MHFTSITTVRGTASVAANAGITIPIGGDAASTFPLTLGLSGTRGSSTIDVTVLDTKEFTQGILDPVPIETVEHLLAQDYESPFLAHLLLGHDPPSGDMRVETHEEESRVGVPFSVTNGKELAALQLEAHKTGLLIRPYGWGEYEMVKTTKKKSLHFGSGEGAPPKTHIHSPEGIIYSLGAPMLRIEEDPNDVVLYKSEVKDWEGKHAFVFFYGIERGQLRKHLRALDLKGEDPLLTCTFNGDTYVLPRYAHVKDASGTIVNHRPPQVEQGSPVYGRRHGGLGLGPTTATLYRDRTRSGECRP